MIHQKWPGLALASFLIVLVVACSSDSDPDVDSAGTPGGADATATAAPEPTATSGSDLPATPGETSAAFPVTIEHKYGVTTIEAPPERVVSVGFQEQDTLLALGIKPVAVREWWNEQPFATWVWARDELGDAEPVVLDASELDFEVIAGLNPDLILGPYGGITPDEYDVLSQLAPTVPQPAEYQDYTMPWREQTLLIGRALGKEDEAQALIDEVNAKYDATREEHPEFAGVTFAIGGSSGDGTYWAYGPGDPRSRLMADLGFEMPEDLAAEAGDEFYVTLSAERANLLDVDVLVVIAETDAEIEALKTDAVFQQLPAMQDGRVIYVLWDSDLAGALSFTSVLSLPYAIDELTPQLSEAVSKL